MSSDNGRTIVIITYILHLVGACTGLLSIVALIINYAVKDDYGEVMASHHRWMIRTFWFTVLGFIVGVGLFITVIGIPLAWLMCVATWLWYIYRHIKGLIELSADRSMSATAWF
ncbi:MAG TPA: hypothetical protein VGM16_11100 [Gammaproteobacteria bacterium]